jgi:formate-dependent nitrite reductase membrane component NrfD
MTFNIIMLVWSTFFTGLSLASGHWVAFGIHLVCAVYWTVSLILKKKKSAEPVVNVSEETKEALKNLGVSITINGKEIL